MTTFSTQLSCVILFLIEKWNLLSCNVIDHQQMETPALFVFYSKNKSHLTKVLKDILTILLVCIFRHWLYVIAIICIFEKIKRCKQFLQLEFCTNKMCIALYRLDTFYSKQKHCITWHYYGEILLQTVKWHLIFQI